MSHFPVFPLSSIAYPLLTHCALSPQWVSNGIEEEAGNNSGKRSFWLDQIGQIDVFNTIIDNLGIWRKWITRLISTGVSINPAAELVKSKLWLAPLAGYTNLPFRRICKEWGADVVVSEMVSADGVIHNQRQTLAYLQFTEAERPFGIQLFGSDPAVMAKAASMALTHHPDFIDINMGCPVKKVIKRQAGGALMADLPLAAEIVRSIRQVLPTDFPLSVKFRSGTDINHLNYLEFGLAMQEAGADIVTLHPRTVKQVFTGVSNWDHIAALKQILTIPVIGNGDIQSAADGLQMFSSTGCDAIMIGRGVLGQPWLFEEIKAGLEGRACRAISPEEKLQTILKHLEYFLAVRPERLVVREIRAHLCFYTKGINGSARLRDAINHTDTAAELKKLLTSAFINEIK